MRNILLVFAHLPPNESFVYGNYEQSGIELLQEELVPITGNYDMDILIC